MLRWQTAKIGFEQHDDVCKARLVFRDLVELVKNDTDCAEARIRDVALLCDRLQYLAVVHSYLDVFVCQPQPLNNQKLLESMLILHMQHMPQPMWSHTGKSYQVYQS